MKSVRRGLKKEDRVKEKFAVRSHNVANLIDGVKEIQPKSNFIYSKTGFDQVFLNGGFTTCFWIYLDKFSKDQHSSILYQWRNSCDYDFRVGVRKSGVYLEVRNQDGEVQQLLSERKLSKNKWYSVIARFEFENDDTCNASLFINSYFDVSCSILNYNPFNYVSVSVGKFKSIKSFTGAIAELFVFFYPLSENEIQEHYQDGLAEIQNGDGQFLQKILDKDETNFNIQHFATEKHIPDNVLKQVEANPTFFKSVKEELTNSQLNDRVQDEEVQTAAEEDNSQALSELDEYIFEHPMISDQLTQIVNNYDWILTVSSIVATGDISKDGNIELTRFMKVLNFSKIKIKSDYIWDIAQITKSNTVIYDEGDDQIKHKGVMYYYLLKMLKEVIFSDILSHLGDDNFEKVSIGDFSDSDDHIEPEEQEQEEEKEESEVPVATGRNKDSFHSSPSRINRVKKTNEGEGEDDNEAEGEGDMTLPPVLDEEQAMGGKVPSAADGKSVNEEGLIRLKQQDQEFEKALEDKIKAQEQPEEEEQMAFDQVDETNSLPEVDDDWNVGEFEVNIIRCSGCYKHFDYSRHSEDEYVNQFNRVGSDITEKFPEAIVIGNHEKGSYLGCFDVYVRGAGPVNKRDSQGRYFIFRKNKAGRFPTAKEITDSLIILSLLYGNSEKLGKAQEEFKRIYGYLIPKAIPEIHEHPAGDPDIIIKQRDLK